MKDISFPKIEQDILKFWKENDIFKKTLSSSKEKPPYVFYDGPPFATGLPHFGNLLAQTLKDIVPRYQTMNGFHVDRRFGWDCHGLPIEHEINKQLGLDAHEALAELGIKKYNDTCRGIVQKYAPQWQVIVERMGRWVDFENDYKTMDTDFMESVWWVFKSLWDKGLVYHGNRVLPYSTALGTPIANFEANTNYQMVQDPAVTILAPLVDQPNRSLMLWTTTPWSLISNLAITVHPDLNYVVVKDPKDEQQELILVESRVQALLGDDVAILERFTGRQLSGLKYEPFYPYFNHYASQGAFQVITDDYVSDVEGTGLVSNAPSFGEDDERICIAHQIPTDACPIDESGRFLDHIIEFKNMYVKEADKPIIKDLKSRDRLWDHQTTEHSYPFCPRTNTPLIYRMVPSWYINVTKVKALMIEKNKEIQWVPEHIKEGRFGKWLENARDWSVSRNRVWGNPIPVWINNETGNMICIGSVKELEQYTGQKDIQDIHRENVDHLTFTLDGEPGTYIRTSEVLDCWFESGSMPFAQIHYPFENEHQFKEGFPAQFIAEGLDQTRGWFYTLHVIASAITNQPAFKNVIVNGIILAESGKKMSKSLKNYTPPEVLIEEFGADALRLYMISGGLVKGEEQRFCDAGVKEMVRSTLLPWYSAFNFLMTYGVIDQWEPQHQSTISMTHPLDRWIISRLESLKERIATQMDQYKLYAVIPELLIMIEELTNIYIRLNRSRFWAEGMSDDKQSAYQTLYQCIHDLSLMMAPFTPFLAEHIYLEMHAQFKHRQVKESVHLCEYPKFNSQFKDPELENTIALIDEIIRLGRQSRNDQKIKVKTPLNTITVIHEDTQILKQIKKHEHIILKELNIKQLVTDEKITDYINLCAKPNAQILGKRLGSAFKSVNTAIRSLTTSQIRSLEHEGRIQLNGHEIQKHEILISRTPLENHNVVASERIAISLDLELNDALILEGLAREIINRVQKTRKEIGLLIQDRIRIIYEGTQRVDEIFSLHKETICNETLCTSLERHQKGQVHTWHEFEIDNHHMKIFIEKI
tara:strand:+ start:2006 stop:5131 length:3126 start_codon:yes stop_codon:yes gene_type:complete